MNGNNQNNVRCETRAKAQNREGGISEPNSSKVEIAVGTSIFQQNWSMWEVHYFLRATNL
jgi:hypothetical protein